MSVTERRKSIQQPRTRANYDNRRDGRSESSGPPDDRTLSGIVPAALVRPRKEVGILVVRPLPVRSYATPDSDLLPGRETDEDLGQTDWLVRIHCASYIGMENCSKFTFLLDPPGTPKEVREVNPYRVFYRAAKAAHDAGKFGSGQSWSPEWNQLFVEKKKQGAAIGKPTSKWFMQAGVLRGYNNKGEACDFMGGDRQVPYGLAPDDDLVVVQVTSGCGRAIMRLLDMRKESYEGDPRDNPSLPFVHGDAIGYYYPDEDVVKGGKFLTIFHPARDKITENSSWGGALADVPSFECAVSTKYVSGGKTYRPGLSSDDVTQVFKKVQFWFDDPETKARGLLNFAPIEQQAAWVASAFRAAPRLVQFAFSEHEEFLTDEVRSILSARAGAVMPDATPEAEAAAPPPRRAAARKDPTQGDIYERAEAAEANGEEAAPPPRRAAAAAPPRQRAAAARDEYDDDEGEAAAPPRTAAPATRRAAAPPVVEEERDEFAEEGEGEAYEAQEDLPPEEEPAEELPPEEPVAAAPPRRRAAAPAVVEEYEDEAGAPAEEPEDAGPYEDEVAPPPRPRPARATDAPPPRPRPAAPAPARAPAPATRARPAPARAAEADEEPVPAPRPRAARAAAPAVAPVDEEDEDLSALNEPEFVPAPAPRTRPAPAQAPPRQAARAAVTAVPAGPKEEQMRKAQEAARDGAARSSKRAAPATAAAPPTENLPPRRQTATRKK